MSAYPAPSTPARPSGGIVWCANWDREVWGLVWLADRAHGEVKRPICAQAAYCFCLAERFARKRDILAQLTHQHIARLYDAGVTDQGQPYLAIEYVGGENIAAYCDQRRMDQLGAASTRVCSFCTTDGPAICGLPFRRMRQPAKKVKVTLRAMTTMAQHIRRPKPTQ